MARRGPKDMEFQPTKFTQMYFPTSTELASAFKAKCASEHLTMKRAMHLLLQEYVNGKVKIGK